MTQRTDRAPVEPVHPRPPRRSTARRAGRCATPLLAALLALAGCAGSARVEERFHTLVPPAPQAPVASEATAGADAAGARRWPTRHVDVLPVSVPAQVDHAQWVVRQPDGSLRLLEQDRWAAPLPDELRAALVDALAARWGGIDVRGVAAPSGPVARVRVDVQRFDSMPGRGARIEAAWSVSRPAAVAPGVAGAASAPAREAAVVVCRSVLEEAVAEPSVTALAAAHRRLVGRLADAIGARLQSGDAAGC